MAKDKTTRRIVTQSVTVVRDGKRITPDIGKPFAFEADEIAYLDRISPVATRKPQNEDDAALEIAGEEEVEGGETGEDETAPDKKAKATATRTPRRGANKAEKKAAAADEDDADEEEDADI